jgi:hypothetical protein
VVAVSRDRIEEIAALVARCRVRMDPERAFALLRAAEELLAAVPVQERLL